MFVWPLWHNKVTVILKTIPVPGLDCERCQDKLKAPCMCVLMATSRSVGRTRDRVTAPELEQFIVEDVKLTENVLGVGAYGTVEEVLIPGARVAAKKLHHQLIDFGSPEQVRKWISDFVDECRLMSRLRHPHVVQFLGICYLPGSHLPVLLMEELQTSLDSLLETTPNIPLDIKVYLLTGTSRGVVYLHSRNPPVIHRDLTARNILIDLGLTAKIADLGVARMVNIQPGQRAATMTQGPGNGLYMPPEAMLAGTDEAARYDISIDIFSFGVVTTFTLTQCFPNNLRSATYFDHETRRLVARSEIERRVDYIKPMKDALGDDHPLVKMTLGCLEYLPEDRPSAEEVLTQLKEVGSSLPKNCTETKLELIQRTAEEKAQVRAEAYKEYQLQLSKKDTQISRLQLANSALQASNSDLQAVCDRLQADKQDQIHGMKELITLQQQQLEVQRREVEKLSDQVRTLPALEGIVQQSDLAAKPTKQPSVLSSITFNWRRCKVRPWEVSFQDQPVVLNGKLYSRCCSVRMVAGHRKRIETVIQYTPDSDQWDLQHVPSPPVKDFSLATLKGQLLVLGSESTNKLTNIILTFDEDSRKWVQSLPSMPTALTTPTVIGYQDYLIVAGGHNTRFTKNMIDVCILNSSTGEWTATTQLPNNDFYRAVLIEDTVFLVGERTKCVLRACVPTLISGAKSGVWETLPNSPLYQTTPISVKNTLLTVGGKDIRGYGGNPVSSIHMYNPIKKQWKKVGDLPKPIYECHCTAFSGGLFVLDDFVYAAKLKT